MTILAIDIGSEFVDIAVQTSSGCKIRKVAKDSRAEIDATLAAIEMALAEWSIRFEDIETVRVGSTTAINALLARTGGRIALLTTEGFGDCLWLGRQNRADLYDPVARSPAPNFLIERENAFEIGGRMDAAGREVTLLDEAAIGIVADVIRAGGIEAVAVCFLYSHLNPIHEQQCRSAIRAVLPDIDICLSHEIDPQSREYERTVSACLEAWLRPLMKQGIATLSDGLRRQGFRGQVFHAEGTGSLIEESLARERVSHLLASGPSASARCAAATACAIGADAAIALDIGSTSADLALIDHDRLQVSRNTVYAGVPLRQWMVDVASFSLGGRSHVSCDRHGQIVFSTDTNNGHAKPTLSDALAYLGRIPVVVPESAQAALVSLGQAVGKDGASAIAGDIVEAAERKLANAILDFAVRRNIDPSAVVLIAMGGLGGILGPGAARLLGMSQVAMPDAPAAAGALGLLVSEPRFDANARLGATCDTIADGDLHAVLSRLSNDAREQATRLGWQDDLLLSVMVEMAVNAQMHSQYMVINELPRSVSAITAAFKSQYIEKYGICPPENSYIFSLTVVLVGKQTKKVPEVRLETADNANFKSSEAKRIETTAGSIWKPAGWSLQREANAYVLRAETTR